jgi:hypothetical protein
VAQSDKVAPGVLRGKPKLSQMGLPGCVALLPPWPLVLASLVVYRLFYEQTSMLGKNVAHGPDKELRIPTQCAETTLGHPHY